MELSPVGDWGRGRLEYSGPSRKDLQDGNKRPAIRDKEEPKKKKDLLNGRTFLDTTTPLSKKWLDVVSLMTEKA